MRNNKLGQCSAWVRSAWAVGLVLATVAACSGTSRSGGSTPQAGAGAGAGSDDGSGGTDDTDDTGSGGADDGHSGGVQTGGGAGGTSGSGGLGGAAGRGGTPSTGGSGGTKPGPTATRLGRACLDDDDCVDAKAPGLGCIRSTDTLLGNGAPPKGLCTAECASQQDCESLQAGSLCFPFEEGAATGYCVEGCSFGAPPIGQTKCHNRAEFACTFALSGDTEAPCDTNGERLDDEYCAPTGTCHVVFPACLPACRGDLDCERGMYCDQSFLSGVCRKQKPLGKGLGEPCTVPPDDEQEPDECLGFCQADSALGSKGHCAATCALGRECAWDPATEKFDGVCLYTSVVTANRGGIGDFGFCAPTCNCPEECQDPTLSCSLLAEGPLASNFRGPGVCFAPDASTPEYDECTSDGSAGHGGISSAF